MTQRKWIRRHPALVRIAHWTNVLCVYILLASGLQIFNAHPSLYWGEISLFDRPILAMTAVERDGRAVGLTTVFGVAFETTGVLGLTRDFRGVPAARGFPRWSTLPSYTDLAMGRRWHFFFAWLFVANGALYAVHAVMSGRLRRDLLPSAAQLRGFGRAIVDHARLRLPRDARHYNVLQRLAYLSVMLAALPLLVATGLAMSPALDAAFPWLPDLFGGRQAARTVHFVAAFAVAVFVLVHVVMVVLAGFWKPMRSMTTGRYAIEEDSHEPTSHA